MSGIEALTGCAGKWSGSNRLHYPPTEKPDDSPSTLAITPMLGGRFVRLEYTWAYQGAGQIGEMILGYEPLANGVTAHWIDTWHMGEAALVCPGTVESDGTVRVRGTYAAPPGPDWGWRIDILPAVSEENRKVQILMYNVTPEGQEEIAVEAVYAPAPDGL